MHPALSQVALLELEIVSTTSYSSGLYDSNFGSKMQGLLKGAAFEIVYFDNNVTDHELIFSGLQHS